MPSFLPPRTPALIVTALLAVPAPAACGGGSSRPSVKVTAGDTSCEVACKPGMTGNAIRSRITVGG